MISASIALRASPSASRSRRQWLAVVMLLSLLPRWAGAADQHADAALTPYRGKIVYLDFWASWCGPCAQSFPWLNEMQAKYGDRLAIVAVNLDSDAIAARTFLSQHPTRFDVLFDPDGALAERYHVAGMPSTVILDASGQLLHQHSGFRSAQTAKYEAAIVKAVDSSPAIQPRSPQ